MVKIEANTDRSFLINGVPYQKGQYEISPLSDETQIKIVRVGSDTVLTKAALVDWVDAGGSPFADFAAFVLYTEPFFFRSVAAGGGSVDSVNGQIGVVVLDADDISDTTTTNKFFDAAAQGVLTNYVDSQNNNTQTSNATQPNLTTYLTLVTTGVDISSFYRFEVSFSVSHDATNSNAIVDIKDFGVSLLPQVYTVEPKDNSNRTWVTLSGRILPNPLGAGQVQLQLDFGTDDAADDTTMYFANISLSKIN